MRRTGSNRLNCITPYLHDKKLYQATGNLYKIFETDNGKRESGSAQEAYETLAQLTEKECGTRNFNYMDTKQEQNSNQVCLEYGCAHVNENQGKESSNRDGETLWLPNYRLIHGPLESATICLCWVDAKSPTANPVQTKFKMTIPGNGF